MTPGVVVNHNSSAASAIRDPFSCRRGEALCLTLSLTFATSSGLSHSTKKGIKAVVAFLEKPGTFAENNQPTRTAPFDL